MTCCFNKPLTSVLKPNRIAGIQLVEVIAMKRPNANIDPAVFIAVMLFILLVMAAAR